MEVKHMKRNFVTIMAAFLFFFPAGVTPVISAKETVKVAYIGPLTGNFSQIGIGGRNSAELAILLRNADTGAKYNYEFIQIDDQCKPDIAKKVAEETSKQKEIIGGITHYCSSAAIECVPIYHQFGFPAIVWGAVNPDIIYGNDYKEIFRVNGTMIQQSDAAVKFMRDQGYKKWVILHEGTTYGDAHNKYFSKALQKSGGEILDTMRLSEDQQDFTKELTRIKEIQPNVIFYGGMAPLGIKLFHQIKKMGIEIQFEGTSGIVSDDFIKGTGALSEGVVAFREGAPIEKLPGGPLFLDMYSQQKYKEPPETYGPFAFVAMNLLLDVIEKTGPDRAKIIESLAQTKNYDSIVGKVSFDEHGQNDLPIVTKFVVQDGEWLEWEQSDYSRGKRQLKK
jgi:branched-chain amino acid transport system substrate-binding protein